MSPYVTLGAKDTSKARTFYDAVLATIGWAGHADFDDWRAYSAGGTGEGFVCWIVSPFNGEAATAGNGTMVSFPARSPAEVDAFYMTALAHGATDEGAPGPRKAYGPNWYAAYLRDPTGNKIAVYHNG